nr:truncated RebC-like FAD-binding monooxygenase [uncultured bacterium]
MTLAMDFAYRNVDFLLVEAGDGSVSHPWDADTDRSTGGEL